MTTAEQALREAWMQLDATIRDRYRSGRGRSGTNELPSQRLRVSVLKCIIRKRTSVDEGTVIYPELVAATTPDHGHYELPHSEAVEELKRVIKQHEEDLRQLDDWVGRFESYCKRRGRPYVAADRGPLMAYAMKSLLAAKSMGDETAMRRIFDERMAEEVRDVAQLREAFADPAVVADLQLMIRRSEPRSLVDAGEEDHEFESLVREIAAVWWSDGIGLTAEATWQRLLAREGLRDARHAWRSSVLRISSRDLAAGEVPAPPDLGDDLRLVGMGPDRGGPHALERSVFERLHSYFQPKEKGFAPFAEARLDPDQVGSDDFVGILPYATSMALAPFSLATPEARLALLIGHVGLLTADSERRASGRTSREGRPSLAEQLGRRLYGRVWNARTDSRESLADTAGDPVDAGTGDVDRLHQAVQQVPVLFMDKLWVRLHNLGLEEALRDPIDRSREPIRRFADALDLVFEMASKASHDALEQGVRPARRSSGAVERVRSGRGNPKSDLAHEVLRGAVEVFGSMPEADRVAGRRSLQQIREIDSEAEATGSMSEEDRRRREAWSLDLRGRMDAQRARMDWAPQDDVERLVVMYRRAGMVGD